MEGRLTQNRGQTSLSRQEPQPACVTKWATFRFGKIKGTISADGRMTHSGTGDVTIIRSETVDGRKAVVNSKSSVQ